ncbi:MAG TPA: hypothetical protein VM074_05975 [Solimonas sp.]|nr:hypothetical protein [Solimonas sp.]
MEDLNVSWRQLCERIGLANAESLGAELVSRYSERHRIYHGIEHLRQVLAVLDELGSEPLLALAAWFHDAVLEPGRHDNEAKSALLARNSLPALGLPAVQVEFVSRAVLATASHEASGSDFDMLLDADLSILAASPEAYDAYRRGIRREYSFLGDPEFKAGRGAFLRTMLARPAIFRSTQGRQAFDAAARRNIGDELHRIETQP